MAGEFEVVADNAAAKFTLKLHRGEGMTLLAMNWKRGRPPDDFVGFGIEYRQPDQDVFWPVSNRLQFLDPDGSVKPTSASSLVAPIQKFRWVHFPFLADLPGDYVYRVTPIFMDERDALSQGQPQQAAIQLRRETYPRRLNVTFTRGFVSSQAFVDRFGEKPAPKLGRDGKPVKLSQKVIDDAADQAFAELLPRSNGAGLTFSPTHPEADAAYTWMGFEAREAIIEVLDRAIADKDAEVCVVAFDLNVPEVVDRLEKLGRRLRVIIDDSDDHRAKGAAENAAAKRLDASTKGNMKRQHLGALQHNKMIAVDSPKGSTAVCGSTNFGWRGFFVQNNNAVVVHGKRAVKPFLAAFEDYWADDTDDTAQFGATGSATWTPLGLTGIDADVTFSPHAKDNAALKAVADDIASATSSVLYSLAFLAQTGGPIPAAIKAVTEDPRIFVYGISDKKFGGIKIQTPDGNAEPVSPAALTDHVPEPFKSESSGGSGIHMHHKFVVIDFDKPTARVYLGSYNFSPVADTGNGENLLVVRDRRVATAYMIEALRIFDHYHFRVKQKQARTAREQLALQRPPREPGEAPWWLEDYTEGQKINDRTLFA